MTREEANFIGGMNMCDEISNEAYKKIMCHCEEQEPILDELRAEITTLQNRCYALTKGIMCAFCKYECEYKAETEADNA